MQFQVLGPVEAVRDEQRLDLGGARQRAVLARLLITPGEVVAVDRLIDDIWHGAPTPSALGGVQAYVSNLRRILEPERSARTPAQVLLTRAPGYLVVGRSDAQEFADLLSEGVTAFNSGDARRAAATLDAALALWHGRPFAEFAEDEWAQPEVARLEELRLVATEHRCAAALSIGEARRVVPELQRLVADHPLREGFWRLLALALYRTGRQADALDALRNAKQLLSDELGLDPSPALRDIEAAILVQSDRIGEAADLVLPAPVQDEPVHVAVPRATVVGREVPLSDLAAAAAEVDAGHPRTVLVSGEAGIGKTWLVEAFAEDLRQHGWRVVWGRCHDTSGAPALWPWLQVLGDLAAEQLLPADLQSLLDGRDDDTRSQAGDAPFRQHDAIRRYLLGIAQSGPLAIVLDDIQWADTASMQLLADVVTMSRSGRILVLLATRDSAQVPWAFAQALVRLDRAGGRRIALGGLGTDALAHLAAASGHEISGERLRERTGGNPLLVRETLRLVDRAGTDQAFAQVPDSVADFVRQRLSLLAAPALAAIQAAAVLGRDVDVDLVTAVCELPLSTVWDAMDAGVVTGILVADAAGELHFTHDLMRETLYGDLTPLSRARLHERAIEALAARPAADVTRLAEHAHAAGALAAAAAVRWSVAAARQANARLAYDDAARWWKRALLANARQSSADPAARVELSMALLRAQLDAGDAMGARETRNLAVLAADELADRTAYAWTLVALDAPALWLLRQFDEIEFDIVARMSAALAELPVADGELRCRMLAALATELYGAERDPRCDEYSAAAVAMARRLGMPKLVAVALNARYLSMNREIIPDEIVDAGQELVALGREFDWPDVTLLGHHVLASALLYRADVSGADEHAEQARRLDRRLNLPLPHMQSLSYRAARLQLEGRHEEAAGVIEEFADLRLTWWAFEALTASMRLTHRVLAGTTGATPEDLIASATAARPSLGHDYRLIRAITSGEHLDEAVTWPEPMRDWGWLAMMLIRAEAACLAGDRDVVRRTYTELTPSTGRICYSSAFAAPVDWFLASLATVLGDAVAARAHLDSLEAACVRESLDWWAERARRADLVIL